MDTTAAAELGMASVEGLDEAENWNTEGWEEEEEEYESQPLVRAPKYARGTRQGEGNGPDLSSSDYGRTQPNQSRSCPSPEPPQKRIRTVQGRQGTHHGHSEENGGYPEETDPQVLDYSTAHNHDNGEWYGAESGWQLGYSGGASGMWYPGYVPGVGNQNQYMNPSMLPNFYHGGMAAEYGSSGSSLFGMPAPPLGSGLENGMRGSSHIFYKTKLCSRFRAGTCTFDGSCNFAHGTAELRKPPPGWDGMVEQDRNGWGRGQQAPSASNRSFTQNQRGPSHNPRFQQPHPCKNYFTKGVCPYGDKCIFLHDMDGLQTKANRDGSMWSRRNPGGGRRGGRGGRGSFSWKAKMCRRWETTGECNYGENCHYAHGPQDLQSYGGGVGADSFSGRGYRESLGVSGPASSTKVPYHSSEDAGPKASLGSKVPLDGYFDANEDWDHDREWEASKPVAVDWQENQASNNDYAECILYPEEPQSDQYLHQQPLDNVPYLDQRNNHNASRQPSSGKEVGVRGSSKNLTAEEQAYFSGYEEGFDA